MKFLPLFFVVLLGIYASIKHISTGNDFWLFVRAFTIWFIVGFVFGMVVVN